MEVTDQQSRMVLIPLRNTVNNHQVNAEISKFLFFLGAKSGLNVILGVNDQNQVVNGELLPYRNQSLSLVPDFNVKLLKRIQLLYRGQLSWFINRPADQALGFSQRLFTANQSLQLTYSPRANLHLGASGQQLFTAQRAGQDLNYFFVDAYTRYKVVKWRTEFEFNLTNIADIQTFGYAVLDANSSLINRYDIRGRMGVLKIIFNL